LSLYINEKKEALVLKNKSSTDLPSSHGGGVLPGNQRGLSGSAATQTVTDRAAVGAVYLFSLNFFPLRKEAFVDPTRNPVFWELQYIFLRDSLHYTFFFL
jgi:hypothetical protein